MKQQKTSVKKILAVIASVVLIAALCASVTFNVLIYQKISAVSSIVFAEDGIIVELLDHASPLRTTTTATTAANAVYTHDLTVVPDVALPGTQIDWTISFKNASSTWAKGKSLSNYATITPASDGALSATLKVFQAFGEQIVVMATLRSNTAIKATCTIDYRRRTTYNIDYVSEPNGVESNAQITQTYSAGLGTVGGYNPSTSFSSEYNHSFMEELLRSIYLDQDFLAAIDEASGIRALVENYYQESQIGQRAEEFNAWMDYHVSTLDNTASNSKFIIPVFNYISKIEDPGDPNEDNYGYMVGFHTDSAKPSDKEANELMLCRFLGLAPFMWSEYGNGNGDVNPANGYGFDEEHYYLNCSTEEYMNQLQEANINSRQIAVFKRAFNSLIDKWESEGKVFRTDDEVSWYNFGYYGMPDQSDFSYFLNLLQNFLQIEESRHYVFFGVNKFTEEV